VIQARSCRPPSRAKYATAFWRGHADMIETCAAVVCNQPEKMRHQKRQWLTTCIVARSARPLL